jgi:cytochrome c peroxidase
MRIARIATCVCLSLVACKSAARKETPDAPLDPAVLRGSFWALPARFDSADHPSSNALVALGRMLYYEPRLSKNQDHSCNSCHDLATGGVDHARVSTGHKGQLGRRNSPTTLDAAGQNLQFWDGRAPDVEAQAVMPILNPIEMAMPDEAYVVRVLSSIPGYVDAFAAAFPGDAKPITLAHVGDAIGAFERGLVTPTRWDAFLAGDNGAITPLEERGAFALLRHGCTQCHDRTLLGGMGLQRLGVVQVYPSEDQGRFEVTQNPADRMMFKIPQLRNVTRTAPYFHDGSIADLRTAISTMGRIQVGDTISDADLDAILAFFAALEGGAPADYIAPPTLPASGPDTPPPDPS